MHGYRARGHYMCVPLMAITRVTIPHVAYDKLHETSMFRATRKRDPRKHVTGIFKVLLCFHACKNEVIIEQYHMLTSCKCIASTHLKTKTTSRLLLD